MQVWLGVNKTVNVLCVEGSQQVSSNHSLGNEVSESKQYPSWEQVSGYFDGDGNVGVEVVKYVLKFKLRFSDTWKPQILTIKSLLNRHGIPTSAVWHGKREGRIDAYRVEVMQLQASSLARKPCFPCA